MIAARRLAASLAASLLLASCGGRAPAPATSPPPPAPTADEPERCAAFPRDHLLFAVLVDGRDVGREVRSVRSEDGPLGAERVIMSHTVMSKTTGAVSFDRRTVRSERLLAATGKLLRASYVTDDQVSFRIAEVGYDGRGWARVYDRRSDAADPPTVDPAVLSLTGDELIGLGLADHLRAIAQGRADPAVDHRYYDPLLDGPVPVSFAPPTAGSIEIDGQTIDGMWVECVRSGSDRVVLRALFDSQGNLWEEQYPSLHQVRRRLSGPLTVTGETSEPLVGLISETYLGLPNAATRAVFRLTSGGERLADLSVLGQASNQSLKESGPDELLLEVRAGAPDGDDPPTADDEGTTRYIKPFAPEIRGALQYLRSAGRRGSLSRERRDNATAVIARAALIEKPARFWKDPDQVAGLVMSYVSALLPDKHHTFSMSDAVTALQDGGGDCTEHAVLFASLMRAHGVPARLVAGLHLGQGGMWIMHMWAAYWNGSSWQAIDPGNKVYRPGALYVAVGRGATRFSDLREDLAAFIDRTFAGVSFDLVEASSNGEQLSLARPRAPGGDLPQTALFNAVVLSGRGDYEGALEVIDRGMPVEGRPLKVKLMRIELLVLAARHAEALAEIAALREQTSAAQNTFLLDRLELDCLLAGGQDAEAAAVLDRLSARLAGDRVTTALLRARYFFGTGDERAAIDLLGAALDDTPDDHRLLIAFAELAADGRESDGALLDRALEAAHRALLVTRSADHQALAALARLQLRRDDLAAAARTIDHALVLAPSNRELLRLRERTASARCD